MKGLADHDSLPYTASTSLPVSASRSRTLLKAGLTLVAVYLLLDTYFALVRHLVL
jgi:hypothetical protein